MDIIGIFTIIISVLTCIGMIVCMCLKVKIKSVECYWVVCLVGAIVLVLLNIRSFSSVTGAFIENSSINPLKILVFFICMTILSIILDNLKFFNFVATKCVSFAKNSQFKLFLIFYCLVSILTVFTSNDIVILAFVPFICYFCKSSNLNPTPYVFATFVAANTWSMALVIGNPTNVYISTFAGIDFAKYFLTMIIPTIVCGVVSFLLMVVMFRKFLTVKIGNIEKENVAIDKPMVILNVCFLVLCTLMLAVSSYVGIEMWIVALLFAVVSLLVNLIVCVIRKKDKKYIIDSLKRAPWAFVPFLLSMFLIVRCLDVNGVTKVLADLFSKADSVYVYGFASFISSNLMNNIPMTTLFSCILGSGPLTLKNAYAVIIGSNLGAILTPVGALAGIMFLSILKDKNVDFSIKDFIKYGVVISLVSLAVTLSMLLLV